MARDNSTRTKKQPKYPLFKYIQLEVPDMHQYTRAYVEAEYRGILKTKDEWKKTLKSVLEGNK
jgi:hypothetical protein